MVAPVSLLVTLIVVGVLNCTDAESGCATGRGCATFRVTAAGLLVPVLFVTV